MMIRQMLENTVHAYIATIIINLYKSCVSVDIIDLKMVYEELDRSKIKIGKFHVSMFHKQFKNYLPMIYPIVNLNESNIYYGLDLSMFDGDIVEDEEDYVVNNINEKYSTKNLMQHRMFKKFIDTNANDIVKIVANITWDSVLFPNIDQMEVIGGGYAVKIKSQTIVNKNGITHRDLAESLSKIYTAHQINCYSSDNYFDITDVKCTVGSNNAICHISI